MSSCSHESKEVGSVWKLKVKPNNCLISVDEDKYSLKDWLDIFLKDDKVGEFSGFDCLTMNNCYRVLKRGKHLNWKNFYLKPRAKKKQVL